MISTQSLELRAGARLLVSNVTVRINHGDRIGFVGRNGAGKSTMMKILSGIYKKDSGKITYKGKDVNVANPLDAQRLGISIIHQEIHLMPHLTVAQNIFIGREPRSKGRIFLKDSELNKMAQELLDELNLKIDPTAIVGELTIARQQMVEIAKAVSFRGEVIIMDEPTSSLTPSETEALFKIIRDLKKRNMGIIYISHRLEELNSIADRISVIRDGEFIKTLNAKDTNIDEIISLMVGRTVGHDQRPTPRKLSGKTVMRVENISTKNLLRDVSFDLKEGEILGFAGLMGSGRTELARTIIGADPKTSGKITLHGKEIHIHQPSNAVDAGIGYLSEDRKRYGLLLIQDVTFNIALSSLKRFTNKFGFFKKSPAVGIAKEGIKTLGIKTPSEKQLLKNLSGGNQQKVVIAKWLAKDCDVLIFDEPTRGIDVGAKDEIYKLLTRLAIQGKSIIMISSELPEVLRMSDRIAVMCEGRLTGIVENKDSDQNSIMQLATKFRD